MLSGKKSVSHRVGLLSPMFFMLLAVGMLFAACPAPEDGGGGKTDITGTFSYDPVDTTVGVSAVSGMPSWEGGAAGQTVTYSISVSPTTEAITVDASTGVVSVAGTVPAGTYTVTVTATGSGDYVGTLSVDLRVTVPHIPITGTFSYASGDNTTYTVRANSGGKPSVMPQWTSATEGQSVEYSIVVAPADEGITVDPGTGVVTFKSGVDVDTYTITVTATGKGNYEGTTTAMLTLEVEDEITLGDLVWNGYNGHDYLRPHKGTGFPSTTPTWSDRSDNPATAPTVSYAASFNDLPAGLSLDPDTGAISGTATTAQYPTGCWLSISSTTDDGTVMTLVTILVTDKKATDRANLIKLIGDEITAQENAETPNLNLIDTSAVTSMSELFKGIDEVSAVKRATFNPDISGWNVGMVTDMSFMFSVATAFNGDISNWNVGIVTDMSYMFFGATAFNGDISNWNVGMVKNMSFMFRGATTFNKDLNNWNVGIVTDMSYMFSKATAFNKDLNNWNVGMVKNMSTMFSGATSFNKDLNNWNVGMVTDMSFMFSVATAFNGDISNWNVGMVERMDSMFQGYYDSSEEKYLSVFNQDISGWNVGMVKNMSKMFNGAAAFNKDLKNWNVGMVTDMSFMFKGAIAFNKDLNAWGEHLTDRMVTMSEMFSDSGVTTLPSWYK